jgi:biopolymer transport protein ExbD
MRRISPNAAPLAGLFLILAPIVIVFLGTSQGSMVELARNCEDCGDARTVVIRVLKGADVMLNQEKHKRGELEGLLHDIYKTRAERVVFVEADLDLPFQHVVEVVDIVQSQVDYVALVTPSVEKMPGLLFTPTPAGIRMCDIVTVSPVKLEYVPLWPW